MFQLPAYFTSAAMPFPVSYSRALADAFDAAVIQSVQSIYDVTFVSAEEALALCDASGHEPSTKVVLPAPVSLTSS